VPARRCVSEANKRLTELLVGRLGERVLDEPERLRELESSAEAEGFAEHVRRPRLSNKTRLAATLRESTGVVIEPHALYDVHVKRIHEYKRQLLNLLETITLWQETRAHPDADHVPRVKIFAGKAAASYERAKLIIKLANDVAKVVNNDPA